MAETLSLNHTPSANRTHIVFMGKMNSGKSALINALANQEISIVSDIQGTTTDPVKKPMEIHGIGPCVLIDTAGFDDSGELGERRVEVTKKAASQADIAVILLSGMDMGQEKGWHKYFENTNTPVITVISKSDIINNTEEILGHAKKELNTVPLLVSANDGSGIEELKERLIAAVNISKEKRHITGNLVSEGDLVLLVMPQDIQAPEGRLILPQVQTIRELLDKKCLVMSVTADNIGEALENMANPPKLIITDSQVYKKVYEQKPEESLITSFSTLFAAYKGDIHYYVESAYALSGLTEDSKVLIAECCTHAPLEEDIGREKIPGLLRKRVGKGLKVDIVSGTDFPENLKEYDVVIQCGACMFNRKYVISRIENARKQGVPVTNYGVAIAWLNGILDEIALPE